MIRIYDTGNVAPAGTDGTAAATASLGMISGIVRAVYLYFHGDQASTTDTTIATDGHNAGALTILTVTDSKTSAWYYPRHQVHSNAAAGLTYDGTRTVCEPVAISDEVTVTWAQADITHPVRAYIVVEV